MSSFFFLTPIFVVTRPTFETWILARKDSKQLHHCLGHTTVDHSADSGGTAETEQNKEKQRRKEREKKIQAADWVHRRRSKRRGVISTKDDRPTPLCSVRILPAPPIVY